MGVQVKGRRVLVIGHADGDGHLAVEQSRRNLHAEGALTIEVLVEPPITSGWRFWETALGSVDFGEAELVLFVDLMFNPREPRRSFERCVRSSTGWTEASAPTPCAWPWRSSRESRAPR